MTLSDVDHVICVSNTCRENLVLRACLHPAMVSTIPNAGQGGLEQLYLLFGVCMYECFCFTGTSLASAEDYYNMLKYMMYVCTYVVYDSFDIMALSYIQWLALNY